MGDFFAQWAAAGATWADGIHQGMLTVLKAFGGLLVAWHAVRAGWGALTGNAKRELFQALWQLVLLGVIYEVVANPRPVFNASAALAGGLYRLAAAPFGG